MIKIAVIFSLIHFHFVFHMALLKAVLFCLEHLKSQSVVFVFPSSNSARCIQFTCFELAYLIIISSPI